MPEQDRPVVPAWIEELIAELTFVGGYVQHRHPDIYEEAMEARKALKAKKAKQNS